MRVRSVIAIAPIIGIGILCTGVTNTNPVQQCYCYIPSQIDCSCCADDPIQSNYSECAVNWRFATGLCSWPANTGTVPKRPWARAVENDSPYMNYTTTNFLCEYGCPHPRTDPQHAGMCPVGHVWIKGWYLCDQDQAVLHGPACISTKKTGAECPQEPPQ